jgi:hypothetical protein
MNNQPVLKPARDYKKLSLIPRLRCYHWGIVFLCFFLPAVEGCNKKIIYPYQDFLNLNEWLQTSIYLYPIILLFLSWLVFSVVKGSFRFKFSQTVGFLFFLAISYLLYKVYLEMPGWYCVILIGLWGIAAIGLLRCRDEIRVFDLAGFLLTAMALWLFPLAYFFREKMLMGGWLYLYANSFIVLTYIFEFLIRCNHRDSNSDFESVKGM